ncbi:NAD+ synthase [Rickettsiaceae bacterium]|nr:NAD+ synthase [Rickettsiaceae bacterium]
MKISVCQIAPQVGFLKENFSLIEKCYFEACNSGADICVFPELSSSGYLAEDLFLDKSFIQHIEQHTNDFAKKTKKTCALLPTIIIENGKLYNGAVAAMNGSIIGTTYKKHLPNRGIFDEKRYFESGIPNVISINGIKVGIPICADIWSDDVCQDLKEQGAEIFIVPNGSPFEKGKMDLRIEHVKSRFAETSVPLIYCNQALSQDGITFDGRSFCFDGTLNIIGDSFKTSNQMISFKDNKFFPNMTYPYPVDKCDMIYDAMVLGTRDYVRNNGFEKVILGLSGGIDSALVASIATDALGANNVSAIMMPSKFTSKESIEDANEVATLLNINLINIPIDNILDSFARDLNMNQNSVAYQNLQSRIRGTILMAESNKTNALLLTTGNKSEYATGYATIYGDMNGAFNPIKDIYKTELYEIARYKNTLPKNVLSKAPSAELAYNQKDSDSLPEYPILDSILEKYLEHSYSRDELYKEFNHDLVDRILLLVKNSEFKRRQSAIGVKISCKNFEKDRRFPITSSY